MSLKTLNASLTVIRCPEQGPPSLVSFNDTGHLALGALGASL